VDDDAVVSCGDVGADGDGECENGVDSTTGAPCTDPPEPTGGSSDGTAAPVDPSAPMAVPDHNAPADVGGCDGADGEAED
jgi:hypothetical protein